MLRLVLVLTVVLGVAVPSAADATPAAWCGAAGRRVQLVYAWPAGGRDRTGEISRQVDDVVDGVDRIFSASAAVHSEGREGRWVRWATFNGCRPTLLSVELRQTEDHLEVFDQLDDLLTDPDVLYLVLLDWYSSRWGGYAAPLYRDDSRPDVRAQESAHGPVWAIVAASGGAWAPHVAAHELAHAMGAMKDGAPHDTGSGRGHCTDGADLMCYADEGATTPQERVCTGTPGGSPLPWSRLLDCGGDDYFDPTPTPGSWLATHWNVADSPWLTPVQARPIPRRWGAR